MPPNPAHPSPAAGPARPPASIEPASAAGPTLAQLQSMPRDELFALAQEYGLHPHDYATPQHVAAALHSRRQVIAAMDREAMLDVIRWGRRPVAANATRIDAPADRPEPELIKLLKKQEGQLAKLARKRRAWLGSLVSGLIGDDQREDYQFLPPQQGAQPGAGSNASIREEIEEAGLIGGITGRLKRTADLYLAQKMDEIEARIDRKLEEIDRRLAEWRDKEVANRLRILKITLWASVIVALIALIYSYIKVNFFPS